MSNHKAPSFSDSPADSGDTDENMPMGEPPAEDLQRYAERPTREAETRVHDRGPSKEALISKFRTEMFNNVLPATPEIPGFHTCWLSTTNQYDSIAHRESWGYTRVKPEDMIGMEHITISQGAFAGCIGLNELVLFKLPIDLWEKYMSIAHHERPYETEDRVREIVNLVREQAREGGGDVYLGGGIQELLTARKNRAPTFRE